jgi:hypothetical protein
VQLGIRVEVCAREQRLEPLEVIALDRLPAQLRKSGVGAPVPLIAPEAGLVGRFGLVEPAEELERRGEVEVQAGARRLGGDGPLEAGDGALVQPGATEDDADGIECHRSARCEREGTFGRCHRLAVAVQPRQEAAVLCVCLRVVGIGLEGAADELETVADPAALGGGDTPSQQVAGPGRHRVLTGRTCISTRDRRCGAAPCPGSSAAGRSRRPPG